MKLFLIVGEQALTMQPELRAALGAVLKKKPHLRSDGIALKRVANRVYLAGNNPLSHYFAVVELLRRWGCRWYMPTEFGECIPQERELKVGSLDYTYSSPFEIRTYWISWLGDNTGRREFQHRNMMHSDRGGMPATGHALGRYTKDLGKKRIQFPYHRPRNGPARRPAGREAIYRRRGVFARNGGRLLRFCVSQRPATDEATMG